MKVKGIENWAVRWLQSRCVRVREFQRRAASDDARGLAPRLPAGEEAWFSSSPRPGTRTSLLRRLRVFFERDQTKTELEKAPFFAWFILFFIFVGRFFGGGGVSDRGTE